MMLSTLDIDSTRTARLDTRRRRMITVAAWMLLGLLVFDLWALEPFFTTEFHRLEPWKIAAISIGDSIGLFWFIFYFVQHFIFGKSLGDRPAAHGDRLVSWWFYASMALGLAADLGATLYFKHHEVVEYDSATRTTATAISMKTRHASEGLNWEMLCRFRAEDGRDYETLVRLHLTPGDPFPSTFSPSTKLALQSNRPPREVPIRYAPAWPARAWLDGVDEDENGLSWFSLCAIGFQAMAMPSVALLCYKSLKESRRRKLTPWWLELQQAIPASVQILVMAFLGGLMKVLG
jgi:hypothetical protein